MKSVLDSLKMKRALNSLGRRRIVKLLAASGTLLLLGQLLLLRMLKASTSEVGANVTPISLFLNVTSAMPLPVVLLDRRVLAQLDTACPFCVERPVAFGALYRHVRETQSLQAQLDAAGFRSALLLNTLPPEPASPTVVRDVPTGCLLSKDGVVILLVLLHERADGFWWYGTANADFALQHKLIKAGLIAGRPLDMMDHEGALERFEGQKTMVQGLSVTVPRDIDSFLLQRSSDSFIECSHSRAAAFREEFGVDESSDAVKFRHKAWKILTKAKQVLDKLNIPFWLSSGTCLGYYRECDLIPYSKDVDLGIMASDYSEELVPFFTERGFKLKHVFGRQNDSFEISFLYNDLKLDLFFFYKEGDTIWNGGTQAKSGLKFKYTFPAFSLCWTEFLEMKVRVPCETLSYIMANYGPGWSSPQRAWDWKSSPPNVRPNGQWDKTDWPQVIQVY